MLISSPEYQLPATISARLGLPIETTLETLRGLKTMGLASHDGERWRFVGGNLHLPKDSPLNGVNHQNWRTRAVLDVQNPGSDGIHYSLAFTVDRGDIAKLRAALLALIDQQRQLITRSGSEELMCFTCDLFTL